MDKGTLVPVLSRSWGENWLAGFFGVSRRSGMDRRKRKVRILVCTSAKKENVFCVAANGFGDEFLRRQRFYRNGIALALTNTGHRGSKCTGGVVGFVAF